MRALLLASALAFAGAAQAQTFSFVTLDNPADPTFNQLLGITDAGTISGYFGSGQPGHPNQGYVVAAPYTSFTAFNVPGSVQTQPTSISASGVLTGFWSDTNTGADANFGYIAEPTGKSFTFISVNDPAVSGSPHQTQVLGINKSGLAVGFYNVGTPATVGFTYNVTTAQYADVKILGATSTAATSINDAGQICGSFVTPSMVTEGFVRNANGGVVTRFRVPHSTNTQLLGINNQGVAVGFYQDGNGVNHGLYYTPSNGKWLQVDDPNAAQVQGAGTTVNGLNNKGQLVGFYTDAGGNTHGMLVSVMP